MAGYKETPRQKMIGMMYLVLTALLALNVSKDILNAFVVVNDGLIKTNEILYSKNASLFNEFQQQYALDSNKVKDSYEKAKQAKTISEELINHIIDLKREIIAYTEFNDKTKKTAEYTDKQTGKVITVPIQDFPLAYIGRKDNYDKPMEIMYGHSEGGKDGKGAALKKKFIEYKEKMYALLPEKDRESIDLGMHTDDSYNKEERKMRPWEHNTFYRTVLYADVTLMNKFIAEVYNAEAEVVSFLLSNITAEDFKFDKITAKVIPKSNYIIAGDQYTADIIVAAYSSTQAPKVYIKEGVDTLKVDDISGIKPLEGERGLVKYSVGASAIGERKYAGIIEVQKPDGMPSYYPFKGNYIVAKPSAVISPSKMNVFYIGIDNPVEISVAGIPDASVSASMTNGSLVRAAGGWVARPSEAATTAVISVSAKDPSGTTRPMGSKDFRIRSIPDPVAKIAGKKEGSINKNELIAAGAIIPEMDNFQFDLYFTITGFSMVTVIGGDVYEKSATGNRMTSEMTNIIQKAARGQKIYFEQIKAVGPDKRGRSLSAISFRIQ